MELVDDARAEQLYGVLPAGVQVSGGSAANTIAGVASFGSRAAYVGRVRDDALGALFASDIRAAGVSFENAPATTGAGTGRCMIVVSPDAERTMSTYLGASSAMGPEHVDPQLVASAKLTYLEGYLWDRPEAKEAYRLASRLAHDAGRRVALSLSDSFCVDRHRAEWLDLIAAHVDVVFANADEVRSLYETDDLDLAIASLREHCDIAAITVGAAGSIVAHAGTTERVAAEPVDVVVDTTGAGDLYAAGFLHGLATDRDLVTCARLGGIAAAEVIAHTGARPLVSLAGLAAEAGLA